MFTSEVYKILPTVPPIGYEIPPSVTVPDELESLLPILPRDWLLTPLTYTSRKLNLIIVNINNECI